jgi:hypothetical protein
MFLMHKLFHSCFHVRRLPEISGAHAVLPVPGNNDPVLSLAEN